MSNEKPVLYSVRHLYLSDTDIQLPFHEGAVTFDKNGYSTTLVSEETATELSKYQDWEVMSQESNEERIERERRHRAKSVLCNIITNVATFANELGHPLHLTLSDGTLVSAENADSVVEYCMTNAYVEPVAPKVEDKAEEPDPLVLLPFSAPSETVGDSSSTAEEGKEPEPVAAETVKEPVAAGGKKESAKEPKKPSVS